jgi:hypothetical protein
VANLMKFPPQMTPKRWFWSFMAAALLWCAIGTRWNWPWMRSLQNVAEWPVHRLLALPADLLGTVQRTIQAKVQGNGVDDANARLGLEDLRARVRSLENTVVTQQEQLREYQSMLIAMKQLETAGIAPTNVVAANVVAYEGSPGSSTLSLDKGTREGIALGMPVVFAADTTDLGLQGVTLLGKVEKVDGLGCTVRLLSDPGSKVRAQIVRPGANKAPIHATPPSPTSSTAWAATKWKCVT